MHRPSWFSEEKVMVCTAPTCGLGKGGRPLIKIDPITGRRVQVEDAETGGLVDAINDVLLEDMTNLAKGQVTSTVQFIAREKLNLRTAVPAYYDRRYHDAFRAALEDEKFEGFTSATIGDLVRDGMITVRGGHGSPSQEVRVGEVPYIKVSDLRAGLININPTNRIPLEVAKSKYWRGGGSGLRAWDLLCPERTSKNIGDFCMLLPGQENVVLTKEVIVLRPGQKANFDPYYLIWAMSLKIVRDQWRRIVFMQTNREDVGQRYLEIEIPVPPGRARGIVASEAFRSYYIKLNAARRGLSDYLRKHPDHHFFVGGADMRELEAERVDADEDSTSRGGVPG